MWNVQYLQYIILLKYVNIDKFHKNENKLVKKINRLSKISINKIIIYFDENSLTSIQESSIDTTEKRNTKA